jgi:CelD/BcsL family acetyltransferase involved in cellulose biosynthesis
MSVQLLTTWDELSALELRWNALAVAVPFHSYDWLATWWKYYAAPEPKRTNTVTSELTGERRLNVLAVYDDVHNQRNGAERNLIGVAPWFLDRSVVKGGVLRWLGSGEVCTDHMSLICHPENHHRVAVAVAEALTSTCDDWDRLDLSAVDAHDAVIESLVSCLAERDCLVSRQAADSCWIVDLPASWDDYLAGISKSHRKQLRQLERRVLDSDRVRWHCVQTEDELAIAWNVLVELHQRRRISLGERGCFASRSFHDFHREVVDRLLKRGQLRMSWMELDGSPAAAEYHLADRRATYAYQGGVDPDRLNEEPGRLSTILCLRAAIEEQHLQLDFLRGDEPYKPHWRATPRAVCDYRVIPNRRLARLRGGVLQFKDALADWLRSRTPTAH